MSKDNSYAARRKLESNRVREALTVAYKANGYNAFYQVAIVGDILIAVASIIGVVLAGVIKVDTTNEVVIGFCYASILFFIVAFVVFAFAITRNNKEYIIATVTDNEPDTERYNKLLVIFDRVNSVSFILGLLWLLTAFILY